MLAQALQANKIPTLVCVTTEYGEAMLTPDASLRVCTGKQPASSLAALLKQESPRLVIDATHPYALSISRSLVSACREANVNYLRVSRQFSTEDGYLAFSNMDEILVWLQEQPGIIFSALGAKEAATLTAIPDYRERIWLRILPSLESLRGCLALGYPAGHIICMQGPFSREMNTAMLRASNADILLTKDSGTAGGFAEKLAAAHELGITAAVWKRPEENGCSLEELLGRITGGTL